MKLCLPKENRKALLVTVLVLSAVTIGFVILLLGRYFVPGILGAWMSVMAGFLSTPFLMEAALFIFGFIAVFSINLWRRKSEGDEYVEISEVE